MVRGTKERSLAGLDRGAVDADTIYFPQVIEGAEPDITSAKALVLRPHDRLGQIVKIDFDYTGLQLPIDAHFVPSAPAPSPAAAGSLRSGQARPVVDDENVVRVRLGLDRVGFDRDVR